MRLNPKLIRELLLTVEDITNYDTYMTYNKENNPYPRLSQYSHEELIYHISQCDQAGLITVPCYADGGELAVISDLTPEGHKFLENIRDDNNWNKVLTTAEKVGSKSLDVLAQIASNVISGIIKSQFLNP